MMLSSPKLLTILLLTLPKYAVTFSGRKGQLTTYQLCCDRSNTGGNTTEKPPLHKKGSADIIIRSRTPNPSQQSEQSVASCWEGIITHERAHSYHGSAKTELVVFLFPYSPILPPMYQHAVIWAISGHLLSCWW